MKNVTGYDLSKLICGSYGTLAIFDEVTLKTLPKPETNISLLFPCDDLGAAVARIAGIFASPHEPNAAAILPQAIAAKVGIDVAGAMLAIIRLEGIDVSIADRAAHLLAAHKDGLKIDTDASTALWQQIRDVDLLADADGDIWKLSCAPASSPAVIATLFDQFDFQFFADWAGGLLWLSGPSGTEFGTAMRTALAANGNGHAQLIRDSGNSKDVIAPLQPLSSAHYALHKRVKAAFDPRSVLNFGRMHDGI
jgi:glycolate oxidase FAD binding subunit